MYAPDVWRIFTLGLLASLVWSLTPVRRAAAQVEQALTVTREPGAEGCPDLERLASRVVELGNRGEFSGSYSVTFTRPHGGFQASIRSSRGDMRVLEDHGADCRALEQATAITLALLGDAEAQGTPPPPVKHPKENRPPTPKPTTPSSSARDDVSNTGAARTWILSAGVAGLLGVVKPWAPALEADIGLSIGKVRVHLGGLGMLPQTLRLGPGTLHESLLSGVARGCVAAMRWPSVRLDFCSGGYLGRTWTEARGYSRNSSAKKTWLAIPIELALVHTARHYWGELGVSALIPIRTAEFAIDGLGRAYDSPRIGGLVSLRVGLTVGR